MLTKRLGIGVLASALKRGLIDEDDMRSAIADAATLNAAAAAAMKAAGAHACTDVTGFGLLGHLREMLQASGHAAEVIVEDVPVHAGVHRLIADEVYAGGLRNNRDYLAPHLTGRALDEPATLALVDPQTSGGLLVADRAHRPRALARRARTSRRARLDRRPGRTGALRADGAAVSPDRAKAGAAGDEPVAAAALRGLAAVDQVLREPAVAALLERYPRDVVVDAVRAVIAACGARSSRAGARPTRPASRPPTSRPGSSSSSRRPSPRRCAA